jgi:hypothetical protein
MDDRLPPVTEHTDIISGSKALRRLNCTQSYPLEEQVKAELGEEKQSDFAAEGTLLHTVLDQMLGNMDVDWRREDFKELTDDQWDRANEALHATEQLFRQYNVVAYIGERFFEHKKTAPGQGGTLDIAALGREDGEPVLIVADYKFGLGVNESPVENYQLAFYAQGLYDNEHSYTDNARKIVFAIIQPWRDDYAPTLKVWETDVHWMEQFRQLEARRFGEMSRGEFEFSVGRWCKFCRARAICPKQNASVESFVKDVKSTASALDDTRLANLLDLGEQAAEQYKALKKYAEDRAKKTGQVPVGYKLVETLSNRKFKNAKAAGLAFSSRLGNGAFEEPKLKSPAQLEKTAKKANVTIADLLDEHVIREATGVTLKRNHDRGESVLIGDLDVNVEPLRK